MGFLSAIRRLDLSRNCAGLFQVIIAMKEKKKWQRSILKNSAVMLYAWR